MWKQDWFLGGSRWNWFYESSKWIISFLLEMNLIYFDFEPLIFILHWNGKKNESFDEPKNSLKYVRIFFFAKYAFIICDTCWCVMVILFLNVIVIHCLDKSRFRNFLWILNKVMNEYMMHVISFQYKLIGTINILKSSYIAIFRPCFTLNFLSFFSHQIKNNVSLKNIVMYQQKYLVLFNYLTYKLFIMNHIFYTITNNP